MFRKYFDLLICLLTTGLVSAFPSPDDRATCVSGYTGPIPAVRVNTTTRIQSLRNLFAANNIQAYIIPSEDAHASEFVSEYDSRRAYISGFSGSAGVAVVTYGKAALWTDGRYFLQAEDELDCNWILMRQGVQEIPRSVWLRGELSSGQRVGASPYFTASSAWLTLEGELKASNIDLVSIDPDLIDSIWTTDRPDIPANPVLVHPLQFAGKNWSEKVEDVREKLREKNSSALIVTSLDETAWLFNLRGTDIDFNPFFISYAIVEDDRIRLYLREHVVQLSEQAVRDHLNTALDGACTPQANFCVEVKAYSDARADVQALALAAEKKVWISYQCNYAIYQAIPEEKRFQDSSPIRLMKAIKNDVERRGMQDAHIRDAVALIQFAQKLEKQVKSGIHWTEISAAQDLKMHRMREENNRGLSFPSISASGSNGAIIHYFPQNSTDKPITVSEMYLLDSGGQYLDGTTDVTRTFHFGQPSAYEKEAYTRVLMGSIDLALLKWPEGIYGRDIDALARAALWKVGLRYRHGTGHGIGAYLSVHEGPGRISVGYRESAHEAFLHEGMFFSDEPGYYEDGKFGVRLETIVMVEKAETKYNFQNTMFLGFKPITLVPFEPNLIDVKLMNAEQIAWLNNYHQMVYDIVGAELLKRNLVDAHDWMALRTTPYRKPEFPEDDMPRDMDPSDGSYPRVEDRPTCSPGNSKPRPAVRVETTSQLADLRGTMGQNNIAAYIIPTADAHNSEYVSDYDARRRYVSGFSGSAGTAVVTQTKAALWTDGRYFLQAEDELDCNWILMKSGEDDVPTITEWLGSALTSGQRVGANPYLITSSRWLSMAKELRRYNIELVNIDPELVDQIWRTDRPAIPANPIDVLPIEFAGKNWSAKVSDIRVKMSKEKMTALVVSSLDETAWLFNLRGEDIAYNPFFISYAIVEQDRIRLYLREHMAKLAVENVTVHLKTKIDGSCSGMSGDCVEVKSYNETRDDVAALAMEDSTTRIWISHFCNYAIYGVIPKGKRYQASSPISLMKSIKNEVERQGMKNAHIRDAVALIDFVQKLEKEVKAGKNWTEVSAAEDLATYRRRQMYNRGLSFGSISASGSNGAIIHYHPKPETDKNITTSEMYLLDSGGQYLDGTTDVTRTFHFGSPTDFEKDSYTRVLMGVIDLALLKWPVGTYGREIDALARGPLWKAGLIYKHGTGHGIGAYLSVHEGPGRISLGYRPTAFEEPLHDGMFFSDEPGYYQDGQFGIRLETIVMVETLDLPMTYKNTSFLGFVPITLVPFEPNLIKLHMLNAEQIKWLNEYHKMVMDVVGKRLQEEGLTEAYNWVQARTSPLEVPIFASTVTPRQCPATPRCPTSDAHQITSVLELSFIILMFPYIFDILVSQSQ